MKTIHILAGILLVFLLSACNTTTYSQSIPTEKSIPSSSNTNNYSSGNTSSNEPYSSNNDTSWFKGGTLHQSTVREWRNATAANRLATSADFVVGYLDIYDFSDMDSIKQKAKDLETCISTAASGGDADDEDVSFLGALCLVSLFPNK